MKEFEIREWLEHNCQCGRCSYTDNGWMGAYAGQAWEKLINLIDKRDESPRLCIKCDNYVDYGFEIITATEEILPFCTVCWGSISKTELLEKCMLEIKEFTVRTSGDAE